MKRRLLLLFAVTSVLLGACGVKQEAQLLESETKSESQTELITEKATETEIESKTESETESKIETETESKIETETRTETESELESVTEQETETKTETETETESGQEPGGNVTEIVISAVGDCTLGTNQKHKYDRTFHEYYDKYGADYFLKKVRGIFEADDLTIANFEGVLTTSTKLRETKQWCHKGKPEYVSVLADSSVEAVTLGNNHIMDYNERGAKDTKKILKEAGIVYAINSDWGDEVGIYETKGIKIGIVSVNELYEGNRAYDRLEKGLKELREAGVDIAIAACHWGGDKTHKLEKRQYEMGRWCIDEGFDLVIGCHPHVIQGIEVYKDKYIVYSMGNFCYGGNRNPDEKESMIFQIKYTFVDGEREGEGVGKVIPCMLSSSENKNDYCPYVLEGEDVQKVFKPLNKYCEEFGVTIDEDGNIIKE